ncbi:hypothetical protein BH11ARM1_BH11ARM1_15370 [soil metagenome]
MSEITPNNSHTVAVYTTHEQADAAVRKLSEVGFDMRMLSIVGQNYHSEEHPVGFVNTGDRMMSWAS